ncbi:MAG: response regulator [Pseudomonadota bacterium]
MSQSTSPATSLVDRFAQYLPLLRRYTRALTGSQASGDAYVRASLTALAENPDALQDNLPDRVALYAYCHRIWISTGAQLETGRTGEPGDQDRDQDIQDERLQALAPRQRQAFLLTAMEGFSQIEAAQILDTSTDDVAQLIETALRDIESELTTKVLVIEDEPIIAADLEAIVEELGHEVTGNATTHTEAVSFAKETPPGLVLCDIQLADDSSGLDAARDILADFDVPVIFITAFPERLLTGERDEPTYLITKPFKPDSVKAAIAQALFFHRNENT